MKTKYIRITKFTLAMMILLVVQFSDVVAQQPRTLKQWFELGKIQNDQKQYSQAVKAFSECIRLDKTAYTCFINRGVAYRNLKKHTEAISDYSEAIRLNPKSVDAYNNRGVSNVELEKYSEAKSDFTKALEIEPNNKAATDNLAKLETIMKESSLNFDWSSELFKQKCLSGNCVNGKGEFVELLGDIYTGDFVDKKFHGKGKLTFFQSGDIYEGDFVAGKKEGQGTYTFKNGDYYIGEYKNSIRNGYGKEFIKATNITREGTWKDGVFVVATTAVASLPIPSTKCVSGDCTNGYGKYIFPNGDIYEGNYVNGKKEGQGTYTSKNGNAYVGKFADGNRNGRGKMVYANGNIYDGNWVSGKIEGQGTFTSPSGEIYIGQFFDFLRNGDGKYTSANGDIYEGRWVDGKKNGFGKEYIKATNTTREGIWKDDVFVGKQ